MSERIPLPYSVIGQASGTTKDYERRIGSDGTIERINIFYPSGSETFVRVEPLVDGTPVMQAEQTDDSADMNRRIIGSNVERELDTIIPVETGDKLGMRVENTHSTDALDVGVVAILDTREGCNPAPTPVVVDRVEDNSIRSLVDRVLGKLGVNDGGE